MADLSASPPRPLPAGLLLALLLLTALALEAGVRLRFQPPGDIRALVAAYQGHAAKGDDVLLFGSCLPEQMLDLPDLARGLAPTYDLEHLATATGTGLLWHVLLRSHVDGTRTTAAIVIPYGGTDLTRRNMPWESQLMEVATWSDVPDLMALDCQTFACRAQIVVRTASRAYRYRSYLAQGIWGRLGTERLEKASRDAQFFQSWREVRPERADPYLYLRRFLALAKERGVRVIFTPLPGRDDLEPEGHAARNRRRQTEEAKGIIEAAGGELRPFPPVPALVPEHFEDDVHVNAAGRALLTEALTPALREWLAGSDISGGIEDGGI